jgi:hypothetical protein
MFQKGKHGAKVHQYKTRFWNAVDCDWAYINENTVFVHYKSKLRRIVLSGKPGDGRHKKPSELWLAMEKKMKGPQVVKKKKRIHPTRKRKKTA